MQSLLPRELDLWATTYVIIIRGLVKNANDCCIYPRPVELDYQGLEAGNLHY